MVQAERIGRSDHALDRLIVPEAAARLIYLTKIQHGVAHATIADPLWYKPGEIARNRVLAARGGS